MKTGHPKQDDVMPSGQWEVAPLKALCERITKGSTPTSYGYSYTTEGIRFVKAENIDSNGIAATTTSYIDDETNKFLKRSILKENDLLFSIAGIIGRIGLIRSVDLPANTNQALAIIRLRPGIIGSKYLFYFLKSEAIQKEALSRIVGVGRANLSLTDVGEFEIPIAPLDQQERIVAEIEKQFSRLDEAVANLKRVKANLKRYKAAVLKAAVEGKLTEEWRKTHPDVEPASELLKRILAERRANWNGKGKYKEPAPPNTEELPQLSDGWGWATVDQLSSWLPGSVQSGPFGSQLLHSEFVSEGILAIGIDNVGDGRFSLGANHRIGREKYSQLRKFSARPNDVVITVMATVGRVCVLPDNLEPAIVTKHCYRITPTTSAIASRFLAVALRADAPTRWYIFGNLRGQTRPGINGLILKNTPVPVSPLVEQECIVAEVERRLSVVEELEVVVSTNFQRENRLAKQFSSIAFPADFVATQRRLHERSQQE
jgi:type I restriction enzyme S subunit